MKNLGKTYFALALLLLLAGMTQGFWMGATNALQYKDTHVAILLPGFVLMAVFGTIYRLWPRLETAALAKVQFLLSAGGAALMIAGTLQQALTGSVAIVATGSAVAILGVVLMAWLFFTASEV